MMCDHVYVSTKEIICSKCNKPTHEIDWDKEFDLFMAYRAEHGILYQNHSWWSI
jgi:hypothetical protein